MVDISPMKNLNRNESLLSFGNLLGGTGSGDNFMPSEMPPALSRNVRILGPGSAV